MPVFNAQEWEAKKGTIAFAVTPRHMVDIWVSCTKEVQVLGVRDQTEIPLKSGTTFRFLGKLEGYEKVKVKGTGQTQYGIKVIETPLQNGEDISDERPPVIPVPEPSNLLLKMRQMSRAHHVASRMPVLEPEDGPSFRSYEFDDDDDVLFEEEAFAKRQEERKTKAENAIKAEGRKEPEADPAKQNAAHSDGEPQGEGSKQKNDPPPPEHAKAAE